MPDRAGEGGSRYTIPMSSRGFTLVEMLIVLALLGAIAAVGIPVYYTIQGRNDADVAVQSIALSLRRAQLLSEGSSGDSVWGVHMATGTVTVFRGASYASRATSFDEVNDLSPAITASGVNDVTYSKVYGLPSATGTMLLTSKADGTRTITINTKGGVSY